MRAFLITAVLLLVAGQPADAGLCRRPDGTYTNHCNEADAEVTGGNLSRSSTPAAKPKSKSPAQTTRGRSSTGVQEAAGASDPVPASDAGAGERYWRDKFTRAKEAVDNAERRLESARSSRESCMARQHSYDACNEDRVEAAEDSLEKAKERLETGVYDECRQSSSCSLSWVQ
jgi:hypothetical protein